MVTTNTQISDLANTLTNNGNYITSNGNFLYTPTLQSLKDNCTELYKQTIWYNIKKYNKDTFTEDNHKNMLSMLESNDKDTLELLRQILIGKIID